MAHGDPFVQVKWKSQIRERPNYRKFWARDARDFLRAETRAGKNAA
jgi:hypothetical protein